MTHRPPLGLIKLSAMQLEMIKPQPYVADQISVCPKIGAFRWSYELTCLDFKRRSRVGPKEFCSFVSYNLSTGGARPLGLLPRFNLANT